MTSNGFSQQGEGQAAPGFGAGLSAVRPWTQTTLVPHLGISIRGDMAWIPQARKGMVSIACKDLETQELIGQWVEPGVDTYSADHLMSRFVVMARRLCLELLDPDPF